MNADFDRLLRLAKKTGDTLIVLDNETGSHHVIMDIDRYEDLMMDDESLDYTDCSHEATLPDQKESESAKEYVAPETRDTFIQKEKQWHAAGTVLDNLYPEFNVAADNSEDVLSDAGFNSVEDIKLNFEPPQDTEPQYDPVMQEPQPIPLAEQSEQETDQYNEEPLGEEPIFFEEPLA